MRLVVASLLVTGSLASIAEGRQPGGGGAGGKSAVKACSLLTKEVVTAVTPHDKQALSLVLTVPPQEDPIGATGSSCGYGGINLQVDPFAAPHRTEKSLAATWTSVPGVGEVAYFRDNGGRWAELYVRAGGRVITVQMDVPTGRTADEIKPNTIALAKTVLPKLK